MREDYNVLLGVWVLCVEEKTNKYGNENADSQYTTLTHVIYVRPLVDCQCVRMNVKTSR